ncbi:Lysine exporter protein (LYSE/YGGA) precursor [Candidatus Rhodobacter oscarellae]|uniref:Lysine exporter protein (LYSE/YGGA) n=1 Tax=Candidatus Rhodobacter oscarellae TaxID=1675527 RepID=A0A0J9E5W6_9RHOB|nr:LysE family transporter [Candidatus Rhodobacter lobularis]KMW58107.1 Lysine exporter protein (LYSE/YGGA) precursor [Candidatus Rhodobacter lobularis]
MSAELYLLYLATLGAFFLGPPDSTELLTISNAMRHGLRRSLYQIGGDLSANALQMIVAAFGLAALISSSAVAITAIKWAGVAYLAYLGLRMLLSRGGGGPRAAAADGAPRRLYAQGFLTALANPWAVIFFAALFPQFIDAGAPVLPQLLVLGATYLIFDAAQLLAYGAAAQAAKQRLGWLQGRALRRISGSLMLGAAALLASKDLTDVKGTN